METLAVTKPRDTARAGGKRAMHLAANPPTGRRLDAAGVQADVRAIDPSKHEVLTALLHVRVPGTQRAQTPSPMICRATGWMSYSDRPLCPSFSRNSASQAWAWRRLTVLRRELLRFRPREDGLRRCC